MVIWYVAHWRAAKALTRLHICVQSRQSILCSHTQGVEEYQVSE